MNKQKTILIFILFLNSIFIYAQETGNGIEGIRKNAVSFNLLGTTPAIGITYERIVSNKISLEIGVGIPSIGLGMKIFPFNIREEKIMFHTGLTATYVEIPSFGFGSGEHGTIIYLPIGMSYFGAGGFNFGIDVGPGAVFITDTSLIGYGNLKVGYRY